VCRETRRFANGAIDVDHSPADATDQMVMVVTDTILESRRRSRRLNAPQKAFRYQDAERVVDRLHRDRADFGSHRIGHGIGGNVRFARDCPQDRQSLGSYLDAALPKEISRVANHGDTISNNGLIPIFDTRYLRSKLSWTA
jgi:hypothetical protein